MIVAMDYDGTYTRNPGLWDRFMFSAMQDGHTVICCTMRTPEEAEDVRHAMGYGVTVYTTSRKAKKPYLAMRGIHPDTWIDDNPRWILEDAADAKDFEESP